MLPYWLLFLFFALGALLSAREPAQPLLPAMTHQPGTWTHGVPPARQTSMALFAVGVLLLLLMIGLRWEVGGDWTSYQTIFEQSRVIPFDQQLGLRDVGYTALNYAADYVGGGIVTVNLLAALPFALGLYRLARTQPLPWLSLAVAVPYLVIVVGMGYTRQAIAIGFLMMGIAAVLQGAGALRFSFYVLLAALFHSTAVILLPLMLFVFPTARLTNLLMILALAYGAYTLFLQEDVTRFTRNYLEAQYSSSGATIRIAQLALAALLFFVVGARSLGFDEQERKIWRNQAVVALAMVPLLLVSTSSTFVDRISLYLLPLQMVVLARLPLWITPPLLARGAVIIYAASVLFVWLNYAVHAFAWVPYQNALFVDEGRLR